MDYRSTPIECLHTILLGPYKYLTAELMNRLTPREKLEIAAKIAVFPKSGFSSTLSPSLPRTFKSFHGRDFKLLAQMSLFILWDYLTISEKKVWKMLSMVKQQQQMNTCIKDNYNINVS